ncbi:MAG: MBL fold metallo-hydrolase [Candidatus Saccharibacteria bacterium]|nr:MBL fold metallo-hydrolase [Moraxellaceae bacterium]
MTIDQNKYDMNIHALSSQKRDGKFFNISPNLHKTTLWKTLQLIWRFAFNKPAGTVPSKPVPVHKITQAELLAAPNRSLFRLGHSTLLLKLRGEFWLTDPVFSKRASPFQWIGPKRFHQPPISIAELPPIKGVILSHNHYDHLDYDAVMQLKDKVEYFLTPLGVGDTLIKWGVPAAKVQQLDWWQETHIDKLHLVATPAHHFSGRGLSDSNATLWASWVLIDDDLRLFFSGDTGYFDGFQEIGNRYGPFDVTMIETGAYGQDWPDVHMQPEQTLQAHLDLKGRNLLPVHNGTFDLALHVWDDPFERIVALAERAGVTISTPHMGERLNLNEPKSEGRWWKSMFV